MPSPIKPVHELTEHNEIFNPPSYGNGDSFSSLQSMFLDIPSVREASKEKYSAETIKYLEDIALSKDEVITKAASYLSGKGESVYSVPNSVNDNELLGLKTQGLVLGSGRAVNITPKGKTALRDAWLTSENALKANRGKDKFDFPTSREAKIREDIFGKTANTKGKFVKIAKSEE